MMIAYAAAASVIAPFSRRRPPMPADSTRRFRLPGMFVWRGGPHLYVTESRTPASDAAGWKMQVERFDNGERFLAQVHHKVMRDAAWSEHGALDEAKAWCEAEVARVAASMMVEVVEGDEA